MPTAGKVWWLMMPWIRARMKPGAKEMMVIWRRMRGVGEALDCMTVGTRRM